MSSVSDFQIKDGELIKYTGMEARVKIPDWVTTVKEYAFSECSSVKNVVISDSVISIEGFAFSWCKNLESVTVSKIGYRYRKLCLF